MFVELGFIGLAYLIGKRRSAAAAGPPVPIVPARPYGGAEAWDWDGSTAASPPFIVPGPQGVPGPPPELHPVAQLPTVPVPLPEPGAAPNGWGCPVGTVYRETPPYYEPGAVYIVAPQPTRECVSPNGQPFPIRLMATRGPNP